MIRFLYIFVLLVLVSCSHQANKQNEAIPADLQLEEESFSYDETEDVSEVPEISTEDAYLLLIRQKIQEQIDKRILEDKNPDFALDSSQTFSFPEKAIQVNEVSFLETFDFSSDSISIKTKVSYVSDTNTPLIDSLLTHIKVFETEIDGEVFNTNEISLKKITKPAKKLPKKIKRPDNLPQKVSKFSVTNLSLSFEEIGRCDCLFVVPTEQKPIDKIYFGRLSDAEGVVQLGKNTERFSVATIRKRSSSRIPGSSWSETYQNSRFRIKISASPAQPRVRNKHTYYIDFTFQDNESKTKLRKVILANCKK